MTLRHIPPALFLFIGTALFAFYTANAHLLPPSLTGALAWDRIYPYFIATEFPVGLPGLLIAARFAAATASA